MIHKVKKMSVLAVGAHPDDIEIGCGATLAKYAANGHDIFLYILTYGSAGGSPEKRRQEQEVAQHIMQAKDVFWGGYKDTRIQVNKSIITAFEDTIKKVNPNLTLVNFTDDTHQDHRHTAAITISATRYIRNVLFYETPTTQHFQPSVYVDIGEKFLNIKEKLLKAHASQVTKTNITDLSIIDIACSNARFRGVQARVPYAEAFQALRLFINI